MWFMLIVLSTALPTSPPFWLCFNRWWSLEMLNTFTVLFLISAYVFQVFCATSQNVTKFVFQNLNFKKKRPLCSPVLLAVTTVPLWPRPGKQRLRCCWGFCHTGVGVKAQYQSSVLRARMQEERCWSPGASCWQSLGHPPWHCARTGFCINSWVAFTFL